MASRLIKIKETTKDELDRWRKPGMTYDEVVVKLLNLFEVCYILTNKGGKLREDE